MRRLPRRRHVLTGGHGRAFRPPFAGLIARHGGGRHGPPVQGRGGRVIRDGRAQELGLRVTDGRPRGGGGTNRRRGRGAQLV